MKRIYFLIVVVLFLLSSKASIAQYTKLLDFNGTANGRGPWGHFVSDGTYLYSMTELGGTNNVGTAFKIKKDGTGFLKFRDFAIGNNGYGPRGSFYYDNVNLYASPYDGGINDAGIVFKMQTDGNGFQKLVDFDGPSGNNPEVAGALVSDGTYLYGSGTWGGAAGYGTVYKVKKDGTGFAVLTDFDRTGKGARPFGALYYDSGFLYGMTTFGGASDSGTIYKVNTNGSVFTKLRDLGGTGNGAIGYGHFISDGTFLYGMTIYGGANNKGTVFKIKPDGTGFVIMHSFTGSDGGLPLGSLISDGNYMYGMATQGGANGDGTVFRIKADGSGFSVLYYFQGFASTDGSFPRGSLYTDSVFLYGMTNRGGANDFGIIFKLALPTGVDELSGNSQISVYPNPFKEHFTISISREMKNASLDIYNMLGERVYSTIFNGREKLVDADLNAGIYLVRLSNGEMNWTKKLVKE